MTESDVMDADGSLHEKSRESDVIDAEGSLHQKPREVRITEDTESIDLRWFDNTKSNRVKKRHSMSVIRGRSRLGGFCETVAEVMDAEAGGEDEVHPSNKKPRVAERVPMNVPLEVEPRDHDFNVNEFLRSSPNPVVALVFGESEIIEEEQHAMDTLS